MGTASFVLSRLALILLLVSAAACKDARLRSENSALKDDLATARAAIESLSARIEMLEAELRLAVEARDWMQYEAGRAWRSRATVEEEGAPAEPVASVNGRRPEPAGSPSLDALRRAAVANTMPIGVPHRVYSRLSRSGDALEDPRGRSKPIPARTALLPPDRLRQIERMRGRTGCFTVRMNLDGSLGIIGSEAGPCG